VVDSASGRNEYQASSWGKGRPARGADLDVSGPKRDEVIGGWRKMYDEELHNSYGSPSIINMIKLRRVRWAGHVARLGEKNAYRILVGKPEGKRPLREFSLVLRADSWRGLLFVLEDGGNIFPRNAGLLSPDYTALYPRRQRTLQCLLLFQRLNVI
jgi:hypothetical protein